MKCMKWMWIVSSKILLSLSFFSFANEQVFGNVENNSKVFSLRLDTTRVVYNQGSSGETLAVINEHDYPILVQAEVLLEDQRTPAPFVITPPLFRLDALQSSRLRIIQTGGDFPADRETLQWVCIKGIPPKVDDKWAEENSKNKDGTDKVALDIQVSVKSCIKLFVRPKMVKGHPDDVAENVKWQKVGNRLKGVNPTPFYINLAELKVGEKEILERHYIAPFGSYEYPIDMNWKGGVTWRIVTDYGGISNQFEAKL